MNITSAYIDIISPYAYCAGDPVNLTDPTGMKPDEPEGARMCDYVYGDEPVELIGGRMEAPNEYEIVLEIDRISYERG